MSEHAIVYPSTAVHISTIPLKLAKKEKKEGKVADCIADVTKKGTASDPGAVCAAMHDKVTGTTMWRGKKKGEADSATTQVPVLRKKESFKTVLKPFKFSTKESNNSPFKNHTFQVILIEEGMGNFKDRFFYSKQALQNAVNSKLFDGVQCYADHPTEIEEEIQPERSTRDILGYYENVEYQESEDGTGCLVANLCIGNSISLDWAMSLLTNSIDYSTKFRESDLVGLSINASGSASPVEIDTFIQSQPNLSPTVLAKLNEAKSQGIDQINVVSELTEAQSVDLVTKAGAGGKILKMLEMEKKKMSKKTRKFFESENESEGHKEDGAADASAMAPGSAGQPDHDDEAQDKALFAKMIKQYLGKDQPDQEEMEMAKHAYQAHKEMGMESHEAYEAAGQHLKMAMAIGKKMAQSEKHESGEDDGAPSASAAPQQQEGQSPPPSPSSSGGAAASSEKKEAAYVQLSGEVAKLRESLQRYELRDYLEKKLRESKRSNTFTKKFREALGVPKSKAHVDEMWKIFLKAADAGVEEVGTESDSFFTEKSTYRASENSNGSISFSDCLR